MKHTLECRVASKRIKKGEPMVKRILSLTETPFGLVDKRIVGRVYSGLDAGWTGGRQETSSQWRRAQRRRRRRMMLLLKGDENQY